MSKLISRLPIAIRKRALECQKECKSGFSDKKTNQLDKAFLWELTNEGHEIWDAVDDCYYAPFYTFHNIEPTKRGAPPKYNEETTTKAYRMPISKVGEFDKMAKAKLKEWAVK